MGSYIEESLSTDERIEKLFRIHWFAWVPVWLWFLLGFLTVGLTWIIALIKGLNLKYLEQGLTNKRVILKTGVISRNSDEMKLKSIETVEISQGIFGRMFNFGSVTVTGRGTSDLTFRNIDDPMAVKRDIESVSNPIE